jgi:hypothetical protein
MAQTVGETGYIRFTLTANQSQLVTLPRWARAYSVAVDSVAAVRVAPGDDATAVEGSTSPANYVTVGVGQELPPRWIGRAGGRARPAASKQKIWVHSAGAAVLTVIALEAA